MEKILVPMAGRRVYKKSICFKIRLWFCIWRIYTIRNIIVSYAFFFIIFPLFLIQVCICLFFIVGDIRVRTHEFWLLTCIMWSKNLTFFLPMIIDECFNRTLRLLEFNIFILFFILLVNPSEKLRKLTFFTWFNILHINFFPHIVIFLGLFFFLIRILWMKLCPAFDFLHRFSHH